MLATVPLRGTDHATVAFGAGSVWVTYDNYLHIPGLTRVTMDSGAP